MVEHEPTRAEYDAAIRERDQVIAERDFILKCLEAMGAAFRRERRLAFHPTAGGVEIRALYPSQADAEAAAFEMRNLTAMVSLAGIEEAASLVRH